MHSLRYKLREQTPEEDEEGLGFVNQNTRQLINNKLSPELEQKIKVANKEWAKAKDSVLDVYLDAQIVYITRHFLTRRGGILK